MTQISKGDTFTDGEQVTGNRLNQLVDSSQLLIGAITDQSAVSSSSVQGGEYVLITDSGTGTLKKAEVFDILGSSLPIVASTVTAVSATTSLVYAEPSGDILLVPYDGDAVTGKAFSSIDGSTVTVSSNLHGLDDGMFVEISATNANYNGVYRINVFNSGSFTYTIYPSVTPASGTCEYTKKASQRIAGNLFVGGRAEILSNTIIEGDLRVIGSIIAPNITVGLTTTSTAVTQTGTDVLNVDSTKIATTAFVKHNPSTCKAWGKITGTATPTVSAGYNIASVSYSTSPQKWNVVFTTAMTDTNYVVTGNASWPSSLSIDGTAFINIYSQSTTGFSFTITSPSGYGGGHLEALASFAYFTVFGN